MGSAGGGGSIDAKTSSAFLIDLTKYAPTAAIPMIGRIYEVLRDIWPSLFNLDDVVRIQRDVLGNYRQSNSVR